jgi:hypothetical protein
MWKLIFKYYITFGEVGTEVGVSVMQHPQLEQLKQSNFALNNAYFTLQL